MSSFDLVELSRHLKQERLFINSEREHLGNLNEELSKTAETVYHLSWVVRKQKKTLNQLIRAEIGATPEVCCQRCNNLEKVNFVDGYKGLSYHESKVGEMLKCLRENPKLVASCLLLSEQHSMESMQSFAQIVYSSIYGDGVMPEDEGYLLRVLKSLIRQQVAQNDNPRRLLRKGSCSFSTLFKLLHENMFSAKLFLTAALHKPIMQLLMEDEWFYDIDPERALYRFPPAERMRRFGTPGTPDYEKRTADYRTITAAKLVMLAERFISSLRNNLYCFPQSLAWLVHQLYTSITKVGKVEASEARILCGDLIFAMFICPAVCDPEPYGITSDAPISYIARHNLMQVAQILQVLALSSTDEIDPKTRDLYEKFEKGCMSSLLDSLLEGPCSEQLPHSMALPMQGCARSAVLITLTELIDMVRLLRLLIDNMEEGSSERKALESILDSVPPVSVLQGLQPTPTSTPHATPPGTPPILKRNPRGREHKKLLLAPESNGEVDERDRTSAPEDVLVVSLGIINECPGMLSEHKVLDMDRKKGKNKIAHYVAGEDEVVPGGGEVPLQEKRTRFSLSHDQDSIATSDNLEAISEAASSHSVGSDDIDNENDNLSDMVSANVSGRGTPNISGRDTPLSQAGSQAESVEEPRRAPDLPVTVQKSNREDVTDRFGKFEIKAELERDDIKSTVSDTWSTDVLASDSEPPEQNQLERLEEVAEEMMRHHNLLGVQEVLEVSETASDAWSTDVLASDTSERQADRLMELDQDDIGSISSRSQGPESEAGDVPGGLQENDETPQGPGCQSPHRGGHSGDGHNHEGGAVGGSIQHPAYTNSYSNYRGLRYPYTDRYSEPVYSGASGSTGGQEARRVVSDLVTTFSHIESNKHNYQSNQRISTSFKYAEGRVGSVLQAFDPLSSIKVQEEGAAGEPEDVILEGPGLMEGSTTTLEAEDGSASFHANDLPVNDAPAVNGLLSPDSSFNISRNNTQDIDLSQLSQDSTLDLLSSESAGSFKLTEQQNFNIDANRLSATISLFDPLMSRESSTDPDPPHGVRPVSAPSGNQHLHHSKMSAFVQQTYNGARPKTMVNTSTPKISVQLNNQQINDSNSLDIFENFPKSGDNTADSSFESEGLEANEGRGSMEGALAVQSTDSKSRSSTDSSCSSLVDTLNTRTIAFQPVQPTRYEKQEEEDKNQDSKKKPSFFKSFKEKLSKGSKRKFAKPFDRESPKDELEKGSGDAFKYVAAGGVEDSKAKTAEETSDDILNKYRRQAALPGATAGGGDMGSLQLGISGSKEKPETRVSIVDDYDSVMIYDPNNLESCKAFIDAKRKLRLVLSTADIQGLPMLISTMSLDYNRQHDLLGVLKMQLAEAINLQDKDLVAQLHETIRCLQQFNHDGVKKLLKTMRDEYKSRAPYIAYLVRCRQGLLSTQAHLDRLLTRVKRDKLVCNKYLLSVLVRLFLEKKERNLMKFISEFQKLTMPDEKTDLVEKFMDYLTKSMLHDQIWKEATNVQLEEARIFIERNVMSHIYTHAIFPNGDGDIHRDRILHEHMASLSAVITPNHKDLRIPKMYHYECPWPAAQAEIFMINAYKTPKDKLACVLRCSSTIMNLLSLANEKSVPAADDFMPVLIFILIKANPPNLLSTIQYVNSFYEKRLEGEEQYWWMQFSSAIEFIKTMDYQ